MKNIYNSNKLLLCKSIKIYSLIMLLTFGFTNLLHSQINLTYTIGGIGNFSNMLTTTSTFSNPIILTGTNCFIVSNGLVKYLPVNTGHFFTNCIVNLDYIKLNISVFPNPANNYTIIKFLNQLQIDEKFRVQVYSNVGDFILGIDVTQKQLLSGYNLSLVNLSAGLYYIQISSKSVLQTYKLLKQ